MGKAPLMVAVELRSLECVKVLLANGADVNAANKVHRMDKSCHGF